MRFSYISGALGPVLIYYGLLCLSIIPVGIYYREYLPMLPFVATTLFALLLGYILCYLSKFRKDFSDLKKREVLFVVVLAWVVVSLIGAIPYLCYGMNLLDSMFESVSAVTTCGASLYQNISAAPKVMLYWRGLTQWIGGLGVTLVFVAIFPRFAVAGRQMLESESQGPRSASFIPKLRDSASALWKTYLLVSVVGVIALIIAGMPKLDAVCNVFSTLSAGGLSPSATSTMGYNNRAIFVIMIALMFISGINFTLQYNVIFLKNYKLLFHNSELKWYVIIILVSTALVTGCLLRDHQYQSITDSILHAAYQVHTMLTATGSYSTDFNQWSLSAQSILFPLMLIGSSAGSAGGGIKVVRLIYLYKYLKNELYKTLHPDAAAPIRIDNIVVPKETGRQILSFIFLYMLIFSFSSLAISIIENDPTVGVSSTACALADIGIGLGKLGAMRDFTSLHSMSKVLLMISMLFGRVEIIPFVAMFHRDFWVPHKNRD